MPAIAITDHGDMRDAYLSHGAPQPSGCGASRVAGRSPAPMIIYFQMSHDGHFGCSIE
ncbi:hypothetical protein SAMN05421505_108107 [Sinosporangium album]|uniref:Uncharacterized protein n=1 Tax=Sinosporangium album TaxID=504805 RepID=A0A1G7XAE8_9ACTN|nr:hypothetical protein SAMN05421505_108107 [Sinosporangium album]